MIRFYSPRNWLTASPVYSTYLAGIFLLLLTGCNSNFEGKSQSNSFFPLEKGLRWQYRVETALTGTESKFSTLSINNLGDKKINGQTFPVRRTSNGTDYYFRENNNGIFRYAKRSIVQTQPQLDTPERLVLPLPIPESPGKSWSVLTQSYTLHRVIPNYEPPYENVAHFHMTYSLVSLDEEVNVPAGNFKHCLMIEGQAQVDQHAGSNQGNGEIEITTREWYAPGVGLVKMVRSEPLDGDVFKGGSITMELTDVSN